MKNTHSNLISTLTCIRHLALMACLALPVSSALASDLTPDLTAGTDTAISSDTHSSNSDDNSDINANNVSDDTANKPDGNTDTPIDFSAIEAMPHELAFTQILSEICPYLLNDDKQANFANAYESYLQLFMPNLDTKAVMRHYNNQKEYRTILEAERRRTLSYPIDENRALCVDVADTPFSS